MLNQSEQWVRIPDDLECSHLYWNKRCVNMDHIIVETHTENKERKHCALQGTCAGNEVYIQLHKIKMKISPISLLFYLLTYIYLLEVSVQFV